jgi:hypothetical protein
MSMGLLDMPAWLLDPLDRLLAVAHLPALARVLLWGALAGYAGMWLYRHFSPQQRIAAVRSDLAIAQRRLANHDGEFGELLPLIRAQFALTLRQLRLTTGAALLAAVPVLFVLPWLSNRHDVQFPAPASAVRVCFTPADTVADLHADPAWQDAGEAGCRVVAWPAGDENVTIREHDRLVLTLPMTAPATIVHRRTWSNALVGNPAGYLADDLRTTAVHIDLPSMDLQPLGPAWLRGWMPAFFLSALLVSLLLRWRWKLH